MGFFDALVKAGSSAKAALDKNAKAGYLKSWESMKRLSTARLHGILSDNDSNTTQKAIAMAAISYNSGLSTGARTSISMLEGSERENKDEIKRKVALILNSMSTEQGYEVDEFCKYLERVKEWDGWRF